MLESLSPLVLNVSIILAILVGCAVIARALGLPLITAYLASGLLIGPLLGASAHSEIFESAQQLAFVVLIFLVGTELSWQRVKDQLSTSTRTSLIVILLSMAGGTWLGLLFHLELATALILGLCLSCTSGIASVKLLTDSRETNSLHGRLTVSSLFVQDIFAIVCLTFLSGYLARTGLSTSGELFWLTARIGAIGLVLWYLSKTLVPWLFNQFRESGELTLLLSLAWCIGGSVTIRLLDIPLEVGALLTGLTLAGSPYMLEVTARLRAIRDVLMVVLFLIFGANVGHLSGDLTWLAVSATLLIIIGRPFVTFISLAWQGYRTRTSILAALLQTPLSEYSIVFALMMARAALPGAESIVSVISAATMASMLVGSILYASRANIVRALSPLLKHAERGHHRNPSLINGGAGEIESLKDHVVLFGYHRMGYHILAELRAHNQEVVVVDFNPEIVKRLRSAGVPALYGDIEDENIYEAAQVTKARVVISTIPTHRETRYLLKIVRSLNKKASVIVTAKQAEDALIAYKEGADYVLLPHLTSSEHIAGLLHTHGKELKKGLANLEHQKSLAATLLEPLYEG